MSRVVLNISLILLFIGILMYSTAGYMDIQEKERMGCISKVHLYFDGTLMVLLAIYLLHFE